jgi:excinuclease ABC subunit B
MPYIEEYTSHVNIAADPVIPYMNKTELQRAITQLRSEMVEAAKRMEFMEAARMRDELLKMEEHLNTLN